MLKVFMLLLVVDLAFNLFESLRTCFYNFLFLFYFHFNCLVSVILMMSMVGVWIIQNNKEKNVIPFVSKIV